MHVNAMSKTIKFCRFELYSTAARRCILHAYIMFIYSLPITPQCHTKRHVQKKRGNFVTARNESLGIGELNATFKYDV